MNKLSVFVTALLLCAACGPGPEEEDPPPEFADTSLAGVVDGQDWTFRAAATDDFLSDEDGFFTSFFGEEIEEPCNEFGADVLTNLPTAEGIVEFSLRRNLTFVGEDDEGTINNVATNGAVRIDLIDTDQGIIEGAIVARFDDDNTIDGTFEATICE